MWKIFARGMVMRQIQALARNKKLLAAALAVILGVAILGFVFLNPATSTPSSAELDSSANDQATAFEEMALETEPPEIEAKPNSSEAPTYVIVYISGAVQQPDVYQVPAVARVKDVVLAAGGLTEDAAIDEINLADRVVDAQHIHIRRQGESSSSPPSASDDTAGEGPGGPLNLNTASAADLDDLPGIGLSIAERIIEYRTTNGPFKAIEDLQNVKGIGPALFAKLAPLVAIGP
ncbi:MAG TPA: ComEA family DNA-binding protein [Roseiflexaceae bacterium]|nr:ComEA family DNA-binding protein [Roseiflexaceae bacterium]